MKSLPFSQAGAVLCTVLTFCLAAPAVAQAPAVDQVTIASQAGSRPYSPAAAFGPDGSAVVVWESSRGGIEARRVGPAASLGPAVQLAANDLPAAIPYRGPITLQRDPVAVPLQGGEFLAIWKEERQEVFVDILFQESEVVASTLQVRRFNRAGAPVGRQFALSDGDLGLESAPKAAGLAGGRVAVVWHVHEDSTPTGVYGRLLGGRGVPHGAPFRIDTPAEEAGRRPVVAALEDGGFVVAWQQCCDDGGESDVKARRFGADGAPQGEPFVIHENAAGQQVWPTLAAGADGELLAAWMGPGEDRQGPEFRVYGQRLAADGTRLGPERALSSGVGRAHGAPTLATLPDGYGLVWTLWRNHFVSGVFGVALDPAGVPRSDAVKLSSGRVQFQWELALATDPAGRAFAAWQGFDADGRPSVNAWVMIPTS